MRRHRLPKTGAYRGNLILVNAAHPCRGTGAEDLVPVGGVPDVLLERSAAALLEMLPLLALLSLVMTRAALRQTPLVHQLSGA